MPGFGLMGSSEGSVTLYIDPYLPPIESLPKPIPQLAKAWRFDAQFDLARQQESILFRIALSVEYARCSMKHESKSSVGEVAMLVRLRLHME